MLNKLLAAALLLIGASGQAHAIDAACTQTTNLSIYRCPENSVDWYDSYTGTIDELDALARTAKSSFTVLGAASIGGALTQTGDAVFHGGAGALAVQESDGGNVAINHEANTSRGLSEWKAAGITTAQISGGTEDNYFNGGGDLGVGVASPDWKIQARGSGSNSQNLLLTERSDGSDVTSAGTDAGGDGVVQVFNAAGAPQIYASASSSGKLGVGTAAPATKVHISSGDLTLDGTTPQVIVNSPINEHQGYRQDYGNGNTMGLGINASGAAYCAGVYSNDLVKFTLCSSGGASFGTYAAATNAPANTIIVNALGVSDATPTQTLDVTGTYGLDDVQIADMVSGNIVFGNPGGGGTEQVRIAAGGDHRVTVEPGGDVGIGTTNPTDQKLAVVQTSTVNGSDGLNVTHSGAITGTGYAAEFSKTGASTTNVAVYASASGGTENIGLKVAAGKRIFTASQTPASASEACEVGTQAWDASYIYTCVATDTWRRVAHATW